MQDSLWFQKKAVVSKSCGGGTDLPFPAPHTGHIRSNGWSTAIPVAISISIAVRVPPPLFIPVLVLLSVSVPGPLPLRSFLLLAPLARAIAPLARLLAFLIAFRRFARFPLLGVLLLLSRFDPFFSSRR